MTVVGSEAAIKNLGSANINLGPLIAEGQAELAAYQEVYPTYYFTEPLAWYQQFLPHVEITQQQNFIQVGGDAADRKTFKSNASHSFGVVYSDFYGRQSSVYPLGSAYVPPFPLQQSGNGGAVNMKNKH